MQGRNTVEEVLRLSAERDYIVFYRNGEDSNVLSDIVVAHPTSIAMFRMWSYVLVMDTTYKTNKVWTSQVMHFGVETTNRAESEHSVLKLWLSTCHGDLDTNTIDMESEMCDLTSLLQEISTGPISNIREVRRLIKGVIHPVLHDDLSQPSSNPPETAVTKGRRKTNSTKRDKKIGKSTDSGSGSSRGSGSGSNPRPRGRGNNMQ
ncbi:hypothetical protein M9H77_32379 [Catharanthus roseus]|uniref:Uncharacterized protein n=1 Tax=Catharanthus roseus TaxID=4058 RepID=A0ACC0A401_CATRO|nr:hypothetical protein M9H77_32379 [Catharanthus roseus]